ncbi:hypothetical protein Ade02nite_92050 [Paractinoplanes deccanensis]|uniref:Pyridoxamine 5'-phosphate oxidase putative domain-containing protein n=1 Tax=Paractinoplanes deccanensis TaxID=113561 RepID=A0ABQ3YKM3_9ACTN|nr:hypothetical protein [Actinoplanes deccanensis]GID80564.1 hypothetical protein Ade02nite_92050 [Actinoplanes deccanensis]
MTSALLDEALKKAALAWISVGDGPALALWCMPLEGSLIVVSGPGEQHAPGLAEAPRATVRLRGDNGGLIVVTEATVTRLTPGTEEWETAAPQLAAKRLNASGTAEEVVTRWAETGCAVVRLTPVADQAPVGRPDLPKDSGAAPPRETPARVDVTRPFRLHRVRKR